MLRSVLSMVHAGLCMKQTALLQFLMGKMGLDAPSLFANTLACKLKRSSLVPTASVFSFGVRNVFWFILVAGHALCWTKWTALLQFLMGKMDWKLSPCLRAL